MNLNSADHITEELVLMLIILCMNNCDKYIKKTFTYEYNIQLLIKAKHVITINDKEDKFRKPVRIQFFCLPL